MKESSWNSQLSEGLVERGLTLPAGASEKLLGYLSLLSAANSRQNLTRVSEAEWVERHLFDSLAVLPLGGSLTGRGLDIGSGAGLPGIPLAIAVPALEIYLVDSLEKRCDFLRQVVRSLSLSNVQVIQARAQSLAHDSAFREQCSLVTARAVAAPDIATELVAPFLSSKGRGVIFCGTSISAITGPLISLLQSLQAQAELAERNDGSKFLVIRKIGITPERFPRHTVQKKR